MRPPNLKQGDTVIILSPSGRVNEEKVRKNSNLLESWGLDVKFGSHVFDMHHKLAGNDKNRASDAEVSVECWVMVTNTLSCLIEILAIRFLVLRCWWKDIVQY